MFLLTWLLCRFQAQANPVGGTVAQGQATFNTSGSQFTVNQTSANAFINWQSFNIANGETTTFNQPSSSSVTWNFIGDVNPSSINGNLNANGIIVLQNPNGITVGGTANINTHGLVMTTASTPALNFGSGGAWTFDAPPPAAQIVNYGQINISGGGSAYLIASDIINNGQISAPGGKIGLYAGEQVMLSTSPNGLGINTLVTLPQGTVDNEGNLTADAGSIVAQAQVVNQNGTVEANSVQNDNGTIELVASSTLALGANSQIKATGDPNATTTKSPGGFVILDSRGTFTAGAGLSVSAGGTGGGQGGIVEFFGSGVTTSLKSDVKNAFAVMYSPNNITLSTRATSVSSTILKSSPNLNVSDLSAYSHIDLWALGNVEVSTFWTLSNPSQASTLNLNAGNSIIVDKADSSGNQCGIGTGFGSSGYDWNLNLAAGLLLPQGTVPTPGNDGIYLDGDAQIYTFSGNINLWAANEVQVGWSGSSAGAGMINPGSGSINTYSGGNISVTAEYGDVNTGFNINGYVFGSGSPNYTVSDALGGISTYGGGNVNITAGRNVISFLPYEAVLPSGNNLNDWANAQYDAGSGTFGSEPGNVTITAGGNVYGHYVVANGVGTVTAGGNVGVLPSASPDPNSQGFALSLISGSWNVYAPNGSIYVQDIDNPNGIFNDNHGTAAYHDFDYAAASSVLLDAKDDVEITAFDAPQAAPYPTSQGLTIPIIVPPSFTVVAGGNFTLDTSVILYPSPSQNLDLNVGGNLVAGTGGAVNLEMSDSAASQWISPSSFGTGDHASSPPEVNNPNNPTPDNPNLTPIDVNVGGSIENVNLYVDDVATVNVGQNMINSSFVGENLNAIDKTSIDVGGNITFSPLYSFVQLPSSIISAEPSLPAFWDSVFDYAVTPGAASALTSLDLNSQQIQNAITADNGLAGYLTANHYLLFPSSSQTAFICNPGFVYDANSLQIGFKGNMATSLSSVQINALEGGTFTVIAANAQGQPIVVDGHLQTITYTLNWSSVVPQLYTASQNDINPSSAALGFQIGGPGQFDITAASINLGNANGILSFGFGTYGPGSPNFASLQGVTGPLESGGAAVNVTTTTGDIDMISSAIGSIDGGDVTVNAIQGNINLNLGAFIFPVDTCYGIWTSGHSDVIVTANGNINVGSSRIATFNGGNVFVESYNGDVNGGFGANIALTVPGIYYDNGVVVANGTFGEIDNAVALRLNPAPYGSGILAEYPTLKFQTPGGNPNGPGNITVITPNGNINSVLGGISQFALDANIGGGPAVTLSAGTTGVPPTADQGNILLGGGPIIGGTVNVTATGTIQAQILSQGNANISFGNQFVGTVLSEGAVNLGGGGTFTGTAIGVTGVNASSGVSVTGTLLSENVSAGGSTTSTLATSGTATAASQSAAQQASQQTTQFAANNTQASTDNSNEKKKATIHVSHVSVILSSAVPGHQ